MIGSQTVYQSPDRDPDDFAATPASATLALLRHQAIPDPVWEPAAGKGHITHVLRTAGMVVIESDKNAARFGRGEALDFLKADKPDGVRTIMTNPPFSLMSQFIRHGLELQPEILVLHMSLQHLGGVERGEIFRQSPPTKVIVLSNSQKVPLADGRIIASAFKHIWVIWEQGLHDTRLIWTEAR